MAHKIIVIFDGVCNLCRSLVRFIIQRDKHKNLVFTSAQSKTGQNLLKQYNIAPSTLETLVVIKDSKAYTKSNAAIEIARNLDGLWKVLAVAKIFPGPLRDWIYIRVAKKRYDWFGKSDECMVPSPDIQDRFV